MRPEQREEAQNLHAEMLVLMRTAQPNIVTIAKFKDLLNQFIRIAAPSATGRTHEEKMRIFAGFPVGRMMTR